ANRFAKTGGKVSFRETIFQKRHVTQRLKPKNWLKNHHKSFCGFLASKRRFDRGLIRGQSSSLLSTCFGRRPSVALLLGQPVLVQCVERSVDPRLVRLAGGIKPA